MSRSMTKQSTNGTTAHVVMHAPRQSILGKCLMEVRDELNK